MHDGMQYDPMQGQGHEPFRVGNPAILTALFTMRAANWPLNLKLVHNV